MKLDRSSASSNYGGFIICKNWILPISGSMKIRELSIERRMNVLRNLLLFVILFWQKLQNLLTLKFLFHWVFHSPIAFYFMAQGPNHQFLDFQTSTKICETLFPLFCLSWFVPNVFSSEYLVTLESMLSSSESFQNIKLSNVFFSKPWKFFSISFCQF